MTRKDFKKLAWALAQAEPDSTEAEHMIWERCVCRIADACKDDNSRFIRTEFIDACRYDYWKDHKQPI